MYYPNFLYAQQPQLQQTMQSQPQPQPQFQQEPPRQEYYGFISVNNEQQARNWPIAPGNSLTFKDESSPYIYTKTMGLSQFETPVFEKYKLTKEEDPQAIDNQQNFKETIASLEEELHIVKTSYKSLKDELDEIKNWMKQPFMSKTTEA